MRKICWQSAQTTPSADLALATTCSKHFCYLASPLVGGTGGTAGAHHTPAPMVPSHSREGQGEVETLPQATESDEGAGREATRGHLTVGLLEVSGGTVALEAAHQQVDASAPILADTRGAAARAGTHLAVPTWARGKAG